MKNNKEFLQKLLFSPQRGQIQIDFDSAKKIFRFRVPVFTEIEGLTKQVRDFVEARKNFVFKPHQCSYQLEEQRVLLVQEIPFSSDFQSTLRKEADQFWKLAQHSNQMLEEIAEEEKRDFLDTVC